MLEVMMMGTKVPALKNNKQAMVLPNGRPMLRNSKAVTQYIGTLRSRIQDEMRSKGVEMTAAPVEVDCVVYMYSASGKMPKSDLDNAYTTVQEALEGTYIKDDRQVMAFSAKKVLVNDRKYQGVKMKVWEQQ